MYTQCYKTASAIDQQHSRKQPGVLGSRGRQRRPRQLGGGGLPSYRARAPRCVVEKRNNKQLGTHTRGKSFRGLFLASLRRRATRPIPLFSFCRCTLVHLRKRPMKLVHQRKWPIILSPFLFLFFLSFSYNTKFPVFILLPTVSLL